MEVISLEVPPLYGQVEAGDRDAIEVPEWETGDETAVSNESMVFIATQSDADGAVTIRVVSDENDGHDGVEVFSGEISLPSGVLRVGNSIADRTADVDLAPRRSVSARIFVEPRELPNRILISIS
ncbi:hypothetical protein [Paractinoplanes lichenicola]|uniref:Uncharacterized protein n=1 Tax=Paractinoplanes lichenicola TaxID=2802976 RepID=A0ABS1VIE1_9ACTN|nr:hypothetical protein [Actinoplanes lichenicola]MBL7253904.1 hypothetical protein [Actinoplanes lichenicola]